MNMAIDTNVCSPAHVATRMATCTHVYTPNHTDGHTYSSARGYKRASTYVNARVCAQNASGLSMEIKIK